jgi:hypothetical protein
MPTGLGSAESGDLSLPLTPLGQGGGAVSLENATAGEMAIETELVVESGRGQERTSAGF